MRSLMLNPVLNSTVVINIKALCGFMILSVVLHLSSFPGNKETNRDRGIDPPVPGFAI